MSDKAFMQTVYTMPVSVNWKKCTWRMLNEIHGMLLEHVTSNELDERLLDMPNCNM